MNLRTIFRSPKQRQIEKELHAALKKIRGPSRGVEIPLDPSNPNNVLLAAACEQLVKDHPELTTITTGGTLTLAFRDDVDPLMDPATRAALQAAGNIRTP